ncbi:hypothetical protein [Endozoicomonas sp. ALB115]|uniref:hypothetical protein n=1 Tax=Endozoicomonas sp. ALB115 TaxID=3403074 RepID=UPI003BB7D536
MEYQPQANGRVFFQIGAFDEEIAAVPVDNKRRFTFQSNRAEDQPVVLPWGFSQKAKDETVTGNYGGEGGETDPEVIKKPKPEQPEIRESYLLMNIITAVVLPARTPLELPSMEISLDIDSFSWSFTGQLWGASNIALVEPDENGPKQIEVNELAKGGNQSITTIELPLTDSNTAPGLIEPGMLVEVMDITGDWQGLCLATSISASGVGAVIKSVDLERHY